jgi:hypothetical protein
MYINGNILTLPTIDTRSLRGHKKKACEGLLCFFFHLNPFWDYHVSMQFGLPGSAMLTIDMAIDTIISPTMAWIMATFAAVLSLLLSADATQIRP